MVSASYEYVQKRWLSCANVKILNTQLAAKAQAIYTFTEVCFFIVYASLAATAFTVAVGLFSRIWNVLLRCAYHSPNGHFLIDTELNIAPQMNAVTLIVIKQLVVNENPVQNADSMLAGRQHHSWK